MDLGVRLKEARKAAGLTQVQLAEALGVKQIEISRWENNGRIPSTLTFRRMCEIMNASADSILQLNN